MWKNENRIEFEQCVGDLLRTGAVRSLHGIDAHMLSNCYEHSVFVAYVSFLLCRRFHWDFEAAARGGLLHDLFLYNQKNKANRPEHHLRMHPYAALFNAAQLCSLSERERDIIVKHMWPLTLRFPKYRESYVVSLADKFCALVECSPLYKWLRVKKSVALV